MLLRIEPLVRALVSSIMLGTLALGAVATVLFSQVQALYAATAKSAVRGPAG